MNQPLTQKMITCLENYVTFQGLLCERVLEYIEKTLGLMAHSDNHLSYLSVKILIIHCLYCSKLIS